MKAIDLSKVLNKFKNEWLLLDSKNNILSHSKSFSKIMEQAEGKDDVTVALSGTNFGSYVM